MSQVNEQLGAASDLDTFLKSVVGLIKDITQFHRVLVYQFDENWNGQIVTELVDWNHTHDLRRVLHFPRQVSQLRWDSCTLLARSISRLYHFKQSRSMLSRSIETAVRPRTGDNAACSLEQR